MDDTRATRRRVLAVAGAGTIGTLAGCSSISSILGTSGQSSSESDNETTAASTTDVFEATIDSVTLVRVFGVDNPITGEEDETQGQGSGFVVDDSYVVTNDHVVSGAEAVDLQYTTGEWTSTSVVGTDVVSDLAVLEVDTVPDTATPLSFSENQPAVGEDVIAIGNPFGLEGSMSRGTVSGVDRSLMNPLTGVSIPNAVQTDAALNPGNSGGPLVDLDGTVVGVVSAGGGNNIGFAVSAALSNRVIPSLIADGTYQHPFMGVSVVTVDPTVADANDVPEPTGVLVTDTTDDGPASGILQESNETTDDRGETVPVGGDIILELDGNPVPNENAFSAILALEASPDESVTVEVYRDRAVETLELTLSEQPTPS